MKQHNLIKTNNIINFNGEVFYLCNNSAIGKLFEGGTLTDNKELKFKVNVSIKFIEHIINYLPDVVEYYGITIDYKPKRY